MVSTNAPSELHVTKLYNWRGRHQKFSRVRNAILRVFELGAANPQKFPAKSQIAEIKTLLYGSPLGRDPHLYGSTLGRDPHLYGSTLGLGHPGPPWAQDPHLYGSSLVPGSQIFGFFGPKKYKLSLVPAIPTLGKASMRVGPGGTLRDHWS